MATANYLTLLNCFVKKKSLEKFYPSDSDVLRRIASQADALVNMSVQSKFVNSTEMARPLSVLALYDIVLLLDDSVSMSRDEGGRRIGALQTFITRIADIATYFDTDGISIRWINHRGGRDNIRNASEVADIVTGHTFSGCTKLGTELWRRVLQPLVVIPARARNLAKPVPVMIITDGEPNKEPANKLKHSILDAQRELRKYGYEKSALAVQIARVGDSAQAKRYVDRLDVDPNIGDVLDCIREEGIERAQELLEPNDTSKADIWLARLLTGAIDSYYDQMNDGEAQ